MVGVGLSAKNSDSKGTTVKKSNQNLPVDATTPAIPEQVSVRTPEDHLEAGNAMASAITALLVWNTNVWEISQFIS